MATNNRNSYDKNAPCVCCGEPVIAASMGGTNLCPWCDMGICRYCHVFIFVLKEEIDGGQSKRNLLEHMAWHKKQQNGSAAKRAILGILDAIYCLAEAARIIDRRTLS